MDKNNDRKIRITFAVILLLNGLLLLVGLYNRLNPPQPQINKDNAWEVKMDHDEAIGYDRIVIPSIQVELELSTNEGYLRFGGWVQNLNTEDLPLVISAHRFGVNYLSDNWDVHQTLFNVTQLKEGDEAEIYWQDEKYVYKVKEMYKDNNNKPLKDSEILLYTCEYWDSVERVFVVLEPIV